MKTPVVSHHAQTCHKCQNPILPSAPRVILDRKTFKCNTCYLTEKYGDTLPKYREAKCQVEAK